MAGKKIKESLLSELREEGYRLDNMLLNASQDKNYEGYAKLFEQYLNFFELCYSIFKEDKDEETQ